MGQSLFPVHRFVRSPGKKSALFEYRLGHPREFESERGPRHVLSLISRSQEKDVKAMELMPLLLSGPWG